MQYFIIIIYFFKIILLFGHFNRDYIYIHTQEFILYYFRLLNDLRANLDHIANWGQPGPGQQGPVAAIHPPNKINSRKLLLNLFSLSFPLLLTVFSPSLYFVSLFFSSHLKKIASFQFYLLPTVCQAISQSLGEDFGEKNASFVVFSRSCPGVNFEPVYMTRPQRAAQQMGDVGEGSVDKEPRGWKRSASLDSALSTHSPARALPILVWRCPSGRSSLNALLLESLFHFRSQGITFWAVTSSDPPDTECGMKPKPWGLNLSKLKGKKVGLKRRKTFHCAFGWRGLFKIRLPKNNVLKFPLEKSHARGWNFVTHRRVQVQCGVGAVCAVIAQRICCGFLFIFYFFIFGFLFLFFIFYIGKGLWLIVPARFVSIRQKLASLERRESPLRIGPY